MDDYPCRFEKVFNYTLVKTVFTKTDSNQPRRRRMHDFNFNFSCIGKSSDWLLPENSTAQYLGGCESSVFKYCVCVTRGQSLEQELNGFPFSSDDLRELEDYCWMKAFEIEMPNNFNLTHQEVDLYFDVSLELQRFFLGGVSNQPIRMVPAADSAVKSSLKRAVVDCGGVRCSICLEDMISGGGDCYEEALCMPCSHVFHGDCIKNWLRVSHYCPLCRFEMPIDDDDDEINIDKNIDS